MPLYEDRTLAVFLCMHRTGSSLTANMMQRLGMSLGPFELIGEAESNKYGHFEAFDFHALDRTLQTTVLGFPDDLPDSAAVLQEFCRRDGQWSQEISLSDELYRQGEALLAQLIQSGTISGFKDPRALLLWPFWKELLPRFPGLRVVPLFLVRSPHEIAMSIFMRAKGTLAYEDALEVTAVHFRRMRAIQAQWPGPAAVVRFDPRVYAADLRHASELCGLVWSDDIFTQVYDATCRHHDAAVVVHPAQEAFESLAEVLPRPSEQANLQRLQADAATRESLVRTHLLELRRQNQRQAEQLQQRERELHEARQAEQRYREILENCDRQLVRCHEDEKKYVETLASCGAQIERLSGENRRYVEVLQQCEQYIGYLEPENRRYAEALRQCQQDITRLGQENGHYAEVLQQCEHYIQYLEPENRRYAEVLKECEHYIQYLEPANRRYAEVLKECEHFIQYLEPANRRYAEVLKECEHYIQYLEPTNQRYAEVLKECEHYIQYLEPENRRSAESLQQCAQDIAQLRQENQQRTAVLRQLQADRDRLGQENGNYAQELQACAVQIEDLHEKTIEQAGQLDQAGSDIALLRQQSARLQSELRLITQSRTWRLRQMVVRPLRRSA